MQDIQNKKVICYDMYGNAKQVLVNELKLRPAVYGIIIKDNEVLLTPSWDGFDFPGGGIELGETNDEALRREMKEETGYEVELKELLQISSSFFIGKLHGKFYHGILFYYVCKITAGELTDKYLLEYEKVYSGKAQWLPLSELDRIKFRTYHSIDPLALINKALSYGE
jgi:8-oxo-dGTP pyrophosphatase MutT (NUDIX family)